MYVTHHFDPRFFWILPTRSIYLYDSRARFFLAARDRDALFYTVDVAMLSCWLDVGNK